MTVKLTLRQHVAIVTNTDDDVGKDIFVGAWQQSKQARQAM